MLIGNNERVENSAYTAVHDFMLLKEKRGRKREKAFQIKWRSRLRGTSANGPVSLFHALKKFMGAIHNHLNFVSIPTRSGAR